ncbi:hypothetical protein [Herbaspirillum sp. alder98]|uniref:hypothetical protein n=1 Tax=Herbaspirillum sp. alder98 TaxID=2913096 RepID=UPI001CD8288F|nr:hypothetical protein [Herbaspirillum sp. alder98]MCA1326299.1 hypothetical protein [Herbaspirillum sp. alder98]
MTTSVPPYTQALEECAPQHSIEDVAPALPRQLFIEESFSLLANILGTGMDEEGITTSFMACCTAAERFWHRNWVWQPKPDHQMLWLHVNKTSETMAGVDFILAIARADGEFDVVMAQAKRFSTIGYGLQNVAQKAFSTRLPQDTKPPYARKEDIAPMADMDLVAYDPQSPLPERDRFYPSWQITRFLSLQQKIRKNLPGAHFFYVSWPDKAGNTPVYTRLDDAFRMIKEREENVGQSSGWIQSFELSDERDLKDLLASDMADEGGNPSGVSPEALIEMMKEFGDLCQKVIVIDPVDGALGAKLIESFGSKASHSATYTPIAEKLEPTYQKPKHTV